MKKLEKDLITKYTVFQAVDGTEFPQKEECEKYEKSALGVLRGKIKKFVVCEPKDAWTFMGGYDDHQVIAIKPLMESDIATILQWYYLEHPYILEYSRKSERENFEEVITEAWKNDDVVLFGINYEKEYYFINSRQNIINNLNSL
jgi:hypothetical protein